VSIINEQGLKQDIVQTIAEQLKITEAVAEQLINDNELEECIDLMYEAETEYISSMTNQFSKRLSVYYLATEEQ